MNEKDLGLENLGRGQAVRNWSPKDRERSAREAPDAPDVAPFPESTPEEIYAARIEDALKR
jgi:hypothetical protein